MKNYAFLILVMSLALLMARAEAQTSPDMRDKVAASCADYFKNIQSLGYTAKGEWKPSANFFKLTGETPRKLSGWGFTWKYVSFQKKFRVDEASCDSSGLVKERNSVAFDGETLQYLNGDRLDLVKKKNPSDLGELSVFVGMKSMFFAPFWFVQPSALSSPYHVDHPPAYQDPKLFSSFMTKAASLGSDPNDPKSLRFQEPFHFKKSVFPTWNLPGHYTVTITFTPEAGFWYPTAWEVASAERGVLMRYEVQQVAVVKSGNGAEYPYPQKAVLKDFGRGLKKKSSYPEPLGETTYSVEGLAVNSKESPALQFMIDPAEARTIIDQDKNAFIQVPH
jgi:hypothetical protein